MSIKDRTKPAKPTKICRVVSLSLNLKKKSSVKIPLMVTLTYPFLIKIKEKL